ncbi:hypothetical protein C0J52_03199 [Blattella germanica]|nr:hypothetical protein C0J52_03199 [Blattella germanica]
MSETRTIKKVFIEKLKEGGGEEDLEKDGLTLSRKTLERWELDAGEGKPRAGMSGGE